MGRRIDSDEWERPAIAAKLCGIASSTIYDAITRGEIAPLTFAGGTQMVRIADVRKLAALGRGRGRPRGEASA